MLNYQNDDIITYNSEMFIKHPDFTVDKYGIHNDIGLIRLDRDVEYTINSDTFTINSVCLPLSDYHGDGDDTIAMLSGFGYQKFGPGDPRGDSPVLREGEQTLLLNAFIIFRRL